MEITQLSTIIEAALLVSGEPLSMQQLRDVLQDANPSAQEIDAALDLLKTQCEGRAIELVKVASGYRYQATAVVAPWLARLTPERTPRYSRALLETLAIIIYQQPVTRPEIENIRGVAVSSQIINTLLERGWVKMLGTKEVPGRPALLGTTAKLLDDFGLASLKELPSLADIKNIEEVAERFSKQLSLLEPVMQADTIPSIENKTIGAEAEVISEMEAELVEQ